MDMIEYYVMSDMAQHITLDWYHTFVSKGPPSKWPRPLPPLSIPKAKTDAISFTGDGILPMPMASPPTLPWGKSVPPEALRWIHHHMQVWVKKVEVEVVQIEEQTREIQIHNRIGVSLPQSPYWGERPEPLHDNESSWYACCFCWLFWLALLIAFAVKRNSEAGL